MSSRTRSSPAMTVSESASTCSASPPGITRMPSKSAWITSPGWISTSPMVTGTWVAAISQRPMAFSGDMSR